LQPAVPGGSEWQSPVARPRNHFDHDNGGENIAVLPELCLNEEGPMNFIQWTKEQESKEPMPSNPKTIKTKQERDRLTRMEAMLDELLLLKKVIVEAKTFQLPEDDHASQT
jgi:hypothetical protein